MKIFVKAKTNAKENKITPPPLKMWKDPPSQGSGVAKEEWYTVSVKERPVEGRANEAITKLLAEHFKVSRSQVRLISGATSKRKVFEIKN